MSHNILIRCTYSETAWDGIDSQEAFSTINIQAFLFLCHFPFPFKIFLHIILNVNKTLRAIKSMRLRNSENCLMTVL